MGIEEPEGLFPSNYIDTRVWQCIKYRVKVSIWSILVPMS